jgi:hypothetical protein
MKTKFLAILAMLLLSSSLPAVAAVPDVGISIDGGALHFPGETTVWYVTTTVNGALANMDSLTTTLYLPGGVNTISLTPTNVGTGVYTVTYTVPDDALTGFYALVVNASYSGGTFRGAAVKGFEVSAGLQGMQGNILMAIGGLSEQLSTIESNVLSALSSMNSLVSSVNSSLSGQLTGISGQVSSAQSNLSSSISTLSASVSSLGTTLQGAITSSQSSIINAINQATTNTQGSVTTARDAILTPIGQVKDQLNTISVPGISNVLTYEYAILGITILTLLVAIALIFLKRK